MEVVTSRLSWTRVMVTLLNTQVTFDKVEIIYCYLQYDFYILYLAISEILCLSSVGNRKEVGKGFFFTSPYKYVHHCLCPC